MRTAKERDVMVARVKKAFTAHPTFLSWPEAEGDIVVSLEPPFDDQSYVAALHKVCAVGVPVGRYSGSLVGKKAD